MSNTNVAKLCVTCGSPLANDASRFCDKCGSAAVQPVVIQPAPAALVDLINPFVVPRPSVSGIEWTKNTKVAVATSLSVFLLICLIIVSTGTPVAERTTTTTSTEEPLTASQKEAMRQRGLSCKGINNFIAPYYVEIANTNNLLDDFVKKQSQYSPEVFESIKPHLNSLATDAQVQIRLLNEESNLACVSSEGTKVSRWDEATRDSRAYDILREREIATALKIKAIVDAQP